MAKSKGLDRIKFLTPSSEVSMGNTWFEIAGLDHFWIERRFEVLQGLVPGTLWKAARIAEFGCGNGCLQRQLEDAYGISLDGFDLNIAALSQSVSRKSNLFCYDVYTLRPEMASAYDIVILFDVLEHISDEKGFLEAVLYHLKPGGRLLLHMPADMRVYSEYDRAVGHVRRYLKEDFDFLAKTHGLRLEKWTYWGLPLYPLLLLRKFILRAGGSEKEVIEKGFRPPGRWAGQVLGVLVKMELLPNSFLGSSIMGIYTKPSQN